MSWGVAEQSKRSSHLRLGFVVWPGFARRVLIGRAGQPVLVTFSGRDIETQLNVFRQCHHLGL
jgi:hypothetical protein